MTQEINEHTFPPGGGWTFRQPQTAWTNPMAMVGFKASVDAIRKHRLANPAITAKHNLAVHPDAIKTELMNYTRRRLGIAEPGTSFFEPSRSTLSKSVVAVAGKIKRAAQGSAVWVEWLRQGGTPEPQATAEKRAATCVACPRNVEGEWYVNAPAQMLKTLLEEWKRATGKDFAFETSQGDKLKSCGVCLCLSKIKAFVPLNIILEKTNPEVLKEFPENCWIAKKDQ